MNVVACVPSVHWLSLKQNYNWKLGKNDLAIWGKQRGWAFEEVNNFSKITKYLCLYLIFNRRAIFVAVVASVIYAICICGQKEFQQHSLAKTSFLEDLFEQCFRTFILMILSLCGYSGQLCFLSSLFQPASIRARTVRFCQRFHWKPVTGAGFWLGAPLKNAPVPAGKAQGGVFPPRFWPLSRPFRVCEISSPF